MPSDPSFALPLISGPAILTNACAVLQNGVNIRYSLAITQWREFGAAAAEQDGKLALLFVDPDMALRLAERRVRLQLRALGLLNAAVALFAAATVCGLVGAFLIQTLSLSARPVGLFMIAAGGAALTVMLGAIAALVLEGACGRSLMRLRHPAGEADRHAATLAS